MRKDIVRRLSLQGFAARTAVAGTLSAPAWALTRFGAKRVIDRRPKTHAKRSCRCRSPPSASTPDKLDALARVGLEEDRRHRGPPRARRSPPASARSYLRRLDQILGAADEPITPRLPVPPLHRRTLLRRAGHARSLHPCKSSSTWPLELAKPHGRTRRRRPARCTVTLYRVDGAVRRLSVATSKPMRDPQRAPPPVQRNASRPSPTNSTPASASTSYALSVSDRRKDDICRRNPTSSPARTGQRRHRPPHRPHRRALRHAARQTLWASPKATSRNTRSSKFPGTATASCRLFTPKRQRAGKMPAVPGNKTPSAPVPSACFERPGRNRRHRRSPRRSAGALQMAPRDARSGRHRRPRTHRHGMVARRRTGRPLTRDYFRVEDNQTVEDSGSTAKASTPAKPTRRAGSSMGSSHDQLYRIRHHDELRVPARWIAPERTRQTGARPRPRRDRHHRPQFGRRRRARLHASKRAELPASRRHQARLRRRHAGHLGLPARPRRLRSHDAPAHRRQPSRRKGRLHPLFSTI